MDSKTRRIVVKKDIYIDHTLVHAGEYAVLGFQFTGGVTINKSEVSKEEHWRKEIVLIAIENEDCDDLTEWWIPFRKDICVPVSLDKQLLFDFCEA